MNDRIRLVCGIAGSVVAGHAGGIVGGLVGDLLQLVVTGSSPTAKAVVGLVQTVAERFTSDTVAQESGRWLEQLTADAPQKQQINHDLQTAFRDAAKEALYDIGGAYGFAEAWRAERDVPPAAVFDWRTLQRQDERLAVQHKQLLVGLAQAIDRQTLLPLNPPLEQTQADVQRFLLAETPAAQAAEFYDQLFAPVVAQLGAAVVAEGRVHGVDLDRHLRRHLLDRQLVHLGELVKTRPKTWNAYNRLMLETLHRQVSRLADPSGASPAWLEEWRAERQLVLQQLEALAQQPADWAGGVAQLLGALGRMEEHVDETLDRFMGRVVNQHRDVMDQIGAVLGATGRIEFKVNLMVELMRRYLDQTGVAPADAPPLVASTAPPEPGEPPYQGLQPFRRADADNFFGRDRLIAELIGRLRDDQFLAVVGASGSGKSSVVQAGLIPALQRGARLADGSLPPTGSALWPAVVLTPGNRPLEALAVALTPAAALSATTALREALATDVDALRLTVARLLAADPAAPQRLLLVVDQFEELFTLCRSERERTAFIANLLEAAQTGGPVVAVITLRADFYAECSRYADLRARLATQQAYIGPMSPAELRRAVEGPAERGGWILERGLVEILLRDVAAQPGALPLLSHALLETWQHRRGRALTLEAYAEAGGISGALAQTADGIYNAFSPDEQELARRILVRLTQLGDNAPDTRRRASRRELTWEPQTAATVEAVLHKLTAARLIVVDAETVEIAHEVLIREWPLLRGWLNEDRAALQVERQLTEAAQSWEALDRDPGALYRGVRLAQANEWAVAWPGRLNPLEQAFLDAGNAAVAAEEQARLAAQQRELAQAQALAASERQRAEVQAEAAARLRRRALILGASLAAAAVFLLAAVLLWRRSVQQTELATANAQRAEEQTSLAVANAARAEEQTQLALANQQTAEQQARSALTSRLTSEALALRSDRDAALLLATAAVQLDPTQTALAGLADTLGDISELERMVHAHTAPLRAVAVDPGGVWAATADSDGWVRVWTIADWTLQRELPRQSAGVNDLAFSPDGALLAAATTDGAVVLWSWPAAAELGRLTGHDGAVNSLAFDPLGPWLVSGGSDARLIRWDLARLVEADRREAHVRPIRGVAFDPTGVLIASVADDGTAVVANEATGRQPYPPLRIIPADDGQSVRLSAVAFSPDGRWLAAGSWDGAVTIWEAATGAFLVQLTDHNNPVIALAFSGDGGLLAAGSTDHRLLVWETETWRVRAAPGEVHANWIADLTFLPSAADGRRLLAAGADGALSVWNLDRPQGPLLARRLVSAPADVWQVAFSPTDPNLLAVGFSDGTFVFWDQRLGRIRLTPFAPFQGVISDLTFSQDGRALASVAQDGNILLWDAADGRVVQRLVPERRLFAYGVAFSPADQQIAALACYRLAADGRGCVESHAYIWRRDDARLLWSFTPTPRRWLSKLDFMDESLILTTDYTVGPEIHSLRTGRSTSVADSAGYGTIAASPSGAWLATSWCGAYDADGCSEAEVWVIPWATEDAAETTRFLTGLRSAVTALAFSADESRVAATTFDNEVAVWDLAAERLLWSAQLDGPGAGISSLTLSLDGQQLALAHHGRLRLWNVQTGAELPAAAQVRPAGAVTLAVRPDGRRWVTSGLDNRLRFWTDDPAAEPLVGAQLPTAPRSAHFLDAQRVLITGLLTAAQVWDVETGAVVREQPFAEAIYAYESALTADAQTAATLICTALDVTSGACTAGAVVVWNVADGALLERYPTAALSGDERVALSADGRWLVYSTGAGELQLRDRVADRAETLVGHTALATALTFAPDGQRLLSGGADTTVIQWDLSSADRRAERLTGHANTVLAVAYSPDGRLIASSGVDQTVRLWSSADGRPIATLRGHQAAVTALAFAQTAESLQLWSVDLDGLLLIWDVGQDRLPERACAVIGRNLTAAEWQRYAGDQPAPSGCPVWPAP